MAIPNADIILPKTGGLLCSLGYDLQKLNEKAIGIVIESKKNKSLVRFIEINLTIWLNNDEIINLSKIDNNPQLLKNYQELIPDFKNPNQIKGPWVINKFYNQLPAKYVFQFEKTIPEDFIYPPEIKIPNDILFISIGVLEFNEKLIKIITDFWGSKIVYYTLYPSGMHKMDFSIIIKET